MQWSEDDVRFMRRAIEIAEFGRGKVSPNPLVGCVLVYNGEIIAEGWHDHLGGLHAEHMAIHDAEEKGKSPNGSTAYVTLEPCNHYGRTPPCTEALLWAGVSKVIIAHEDPNPTVRGQGMTALQNSGIDVEIGLLHDEAAAQMRSFLHWCKNRRPLVSVKLAVDSTGSVDDLSKDSQRFTSDECLDEVHKLRRDCDAILVGVGTVVRDDPSLTIRRVESPNQPLRIVIDPSGRIPANCKLLNDGGETMILKENFRGLSRMLDMLADQEIQRVLVEGGPATIQGFLSARLVDEFFLVKSESTHSSPLPSNISEQDLIDAGLNLKHSIQWGTETVEHWLCE